MEPRVRQRPGFGGRKGSLLEKFYLDRWFGATAGIILGLVFIAIVLFLPYGIVGTWRLKARERAAGWNRLREMVRRGS